MLLGVKRGYRDLLFAALLSFGCVPAYGQYVNPSQEELRVDVERFSLDASDEQFARRLPLAELQQRVLLERARFGSSMSVDELHQVADALTMFVRNLGFVFHTIYLPPQRVEGGLVELRLQEGVLGSVHVINSTSIADEHFARVFEDQLGQVLYGPSIEDDVQGLKAQGGVSVFPFYSRGVKAGEARLNLKVDKTRKRSFSLKLDNYGSASSGEHRLIAQYSEYQLTGRHDRLSLAVLRSVDEVANTYGNINYTLPFAGLDYSWDVSASNNQFEVGDRFAALGLQGAASTVASGVSRYIKHHPKNRSRVRLGIYERRNNLDLVDDNASTEVSRELSRAASLLWAKDKQWSESGTALNVFAEFSHGEYEIGERAASFNKLDLSGFIAKGAGSGRLRNLLQMSFRGQYSDTVLPSIEAFSLTGVYGVRGFEPGRFSADNALMASLEWRLPALLTFSAEQSWHIEPYLVADWASGTKDNSDGNRDEANFSSAGVGLRLGLGRHLSAQVTAAKALDGEINTNKVEGDEQVLFEIRWH